ncbi:hypothetical protein [Flavobacterium crassostreae]|uniref:Uncharacterized protein n=1 Tax=Flavobacterium crassostreae TaxID=1763534 RepID=A0A1B9EA31_9FLAO|nr:hypothetical protein [Flavobacterium crassostreae]OCB78815.1 hypothetical protein LPBF_00050 [Flavobacterium crassostreae]
MKKYTLLFFVLITIPVFSQDSDLTMYFENKETVSFEQYDLIKDINRFYPDILVSKRIKNNYKTTFKEKEILTSDFIYDLPKDCEYYFVSIDNNSHSLNYSYMLSDKTSISGSVKKFNGKFIRTVYKSKNNIRIIQFYIDGKLIHEYSN